MNISDHLGDFSFDSRLVILVVHFTTWLGIALLMRMVWAKRPARAHRAMTLATVAAFLSPAAAILVQTLGWGVLPAQPASVSITSLSSPGIDRPQKDGGPQRRNELQLAGDPREVAAAADNVLSIPPMTSVYRGDSQPGSQGLARSRSFFLFALWPIMSGVLLIRMIRSFARCREVVIAASEHQAAAWHAALDDALACMQIELSPKILTSPHIGTPVIWCWSKRPVLLIPKSMADANLGRDAWRMIFCHELAHLQRRDHWSCLWSDLLVTLVPWHPLSWYVRRELLILQELACDDHVLHLSDDHVAYAETLLLAASPNRHRVALAMAHQCAGLRRRLSRILTAGGASPSTGTGWLTGLILLVVFAVAVGALAQAPTEETPKPLPQHQNRTSQEADGGMGSEVSRARQDLDYLADEPVNLDKEPGWQPTLKDYALEQALARNASATINEPAAVRYLREVLAASDATQAERVATKAADSGLAGEWIGRIYVRVTQRHEQQGDFRETIAWAQAALHHPISAYERVKMLQSWSRAADQLNRLDAQRKGGYVVKLPAFLAAIEVPKARREHPKSLRETLYLTDANGELTTFAKWYTGRRATVDIDFLEAERHLLMPPMTGRPRRVEPSIHQGVRDFVEAMQVSERDWQTTPKLPWLSDHYAFSQTLPLDVTPVLRSVANLVDRIADHENFFDDLLSSLQQDHNGPQIDLRGDLFPHLGNQVSVIVHYANPGILQGEAALIVVPLTMSEPVERLLDQLHTNDPEEVIVSLHRTVRIMSAGELMGQPLFLSVHKEHVLLSTSDWLLHDVLDQMQ